MMLTIVILLVCSVLAFGISAICGGGAGLMLIPILSQLLPISQVPAALSIGTFGSSASRIVVFKKHIHWKIVAYFVPAALPSVFLGVWLLKFINPNYIEIVMALFLVSNLPFLFKKEKTENTKSSPNYYHLVWIGALAGFISGITGAVGVLFNRFYLKFGLSKEGIVATRAANEIILHLIKIILYACFGLISLKVIYIGLAVAVAAVFSTWLMKHLLPKISFNGFRKMGYTAMVVSGVFMIQHSGSNLMQSNQAKVVFATKDKGVKTKLFWKNNRYTLELDTKKGYEFEKTISIDSLDENQKSIVLNRDIKSDNIVVEAVHKFGSKTYEAYYYHNKVLVEKIYFE